MTIKQDEFLIQNNSWWIHEKSGKRYTVLFVANQKSDHEHKDEFPETVVYIDKENLIWTLPREKFLERFYLANKESQPKD